MAKQRRDAEQAEAFVFNFNTPTGRAEANAIKDVVARRISELRSNDVGVPRIGAHVAGTTPLDGAATAAAAVASATPVWLDDAKLKTDIELQHSLLKKHPSLHQTYMAAHADKPDAISSAAFNSQFWATRTDLLRAHAVETNQKKGAYHVLAVVKPKAVENEGLKLSLNVEQVQMILAQHPIVKKLYDQNVPRITEADFWSKFFLSRLRKRLCGEELLPTDRPIPLFDRNGLDDEHDAEAEAEAQQDLAGSEDFRVRRIINVEGNEDNQGGFKSGNRKDIEMRATKKMPIMGVINSVSRKLMANVAPTSVELDDAGLDDATYREVALRDLAPVEKEKRIALNVRDQRGYYAARDELDEAMDAAMAETMDAAEVKSIVGGDLDRLPADQSGSGIDLHAMIGFNPDESDSEDELGGGGAGGAGANNTSSNGAAKEDKSSGGRVNSRSSLKLAQQDLVQRVHQRHDELYGDSDNTNVSQLSPAMMERCVLTNASTVEFVRQFWNAFLSGNPDRVTELSNTVGAIGRSLERIEAVASDAEMEREASITQKKRDVRAYFEKTGKKVRWNADMVGGGRAEVEALLIGPIEAIARAQAVYKKALEEARREEEE